MTVCSLSSFTNKFGFVSLEAVQLKLKCVFDGFYWKWAGLVRPPAELGKLVCPEELRLQSNRNKVAFWYVSLAGKGGSNTAEPIPECQADTGSYLTV